MDHPVQLAVLAAGCQPWNFQVVAATRNRFAYCATLSVYIFERKSRAKQYILHSIVTEHKKGITSICWHPTDLDLICTSSADKSIIIWNVAERRQFKQISHLSDSPKSSCFHGDYVTFATNSSIYFWRYLAGNGAISTPKEYSVSFTSDISVLRFSQGLSGKALVGHSNGTVSLLCRGKKCHRHVDISAEDEDGESTIVDIQWDAHSTDYALVISYQKSVVMLDTESMSVLVRYKLPSRASYVQTLAWIPGASGVFVTGDQQSGVLRLWNVSKSEPLENIKVKKTGFHAMCAVRKQYDIDAQSDNVSLGTSCPPIYLICTFVDGGVGLYDLQCRRWCYLREQGHIETVFDCKFSPLESHRLATASFDGSVKIWDTSQPDLVCECSSPGNEGILYQISWAPLDLNCIAVATAKYGVFIWDVGKGKITRRFHEHGSEACVYAVCWNQLNTSKLLSGGNDHFAIVRDVDGCNVVKFRHPGTVFGCQWSPFNPSLFATGSEDGKVRVFFLPPGPQEQTIVHTAVKVFEGHSRKSFHVKWSPLRDGYLASSSDDACIRVWSYGEDACTQVLRGHTSNTRGICWSPEIAYLLYSGSWDHTIILWDVRTGSRLAKLEDHTNDVYGLSIHKAQPFILASCSRDSTVRLWSTCQVVPRLSLRTLTKQFKTEAIFATADPDVNFNKFEVAMVASAPPLLSGTESNKIRQRIVNKSLTGHFSISSRLQQLFKCGIGVENLFDLVKVIQGKPESSLSEGYGKGIVHCKHLTGFKQSEANELDMVRTSHGGGHIGAPSKHDRVEKAAECFLKLGNLRKYCELLVENGEWEKALSIAPAVSMKFWKTLLNRYTEHLQANKPSHLLPFKTAQREPQNLVNYLLNGGQYQDALLAAVVGIQSIPLPDVNNTEASLHGVDNQVLLADAIDKLATHYMDIGQPVLAACVFLSADMLEKAICTLIKSNLLEMAFTLGQMVNMDKDLMAFIIDSLARRCEAIDELKLAIDILKSVDGTDMAVVMLCLRNSGWECDKLAELVKYHDTHYPPLSQLPTLTGAAQLLSASGDQSASERIRLLMLSNSQSDGLVLAMHTLYGLMRRDNFSLTDEVKMILDYAQSVPSEKLTKHPVQLFDLLTASCYLGALLAVRAGYDVIVPHLLALTITRLSFESSQTFPISVDVIRLEAEEWSNRLGSEEKMSLRIKAGYCTPHPLNGEIQVPGCSLPGFSSHNLTSIITGKLIQGRAYKLEDGKSAMSISEAIMWSHINPFSPISCCQAVAVANKMTVF